MRAICQICNEFIGIVEIDGYTETDSNTGQIFTIKPLRYPLTGDMFGSPDRTHGYPDPFDPSLDWEPMRCPYGRIHRPMVQDDLVMTHKGMVRLPKDGSKAFLDPTAKSEVNRDSIGDRTMQVPDDVAEKMAREALAPKDTVILVMSDGEEVDTGIPVDEMPKRKDFPCLLCDKEFDTKRGLDGHMGGAHKPPKVISKSHPLPKRKRK